MVQFVSLFLGLIVGIHPVELAVVGDRVASVELLLDGDRVGEARGEPWIIECDFGEPLRPHVLVAVARDSEGAILGRTEQRVNVPRSGAELRILLEDAGSRRNVRLLWRVLDESSPRAVNVTLDGVALLMQEPDRVELPPVDPGQAHVVTAEVEFSDYVSARAEIAFGGHFGDSAVAELTGIPLRNLRKKNPPDAKQLERWLEVDNAPVRVVAVEDGTRDLLMLRDHQAVGSLETLHRKAISARNLRVRKGQFGWSVPPGMQVSDSVRLVGTTPKTVSAAGRETRLFSVSPDVGGDKLGSIPLALFSELPEPLDSTPQSFASAVSAAGSVAAAGKRVRAVILVKEHDSPDVSDIDVRNARRYLEILGIPLFVWRPSGTPGARDDGWGEGDDISSLSALAKAIKRLDKSLEAQFVVWIDGDHLPGEVSLNDAGRSTVRFAGAP